MTYAPNASSTLTRIIEDIELTCIDIGARHGFTDDLLTIASAVNAVGFEPDAAECARLNANAEAGGHPWRRLRFVPVALGDGNAGRQLHLYRQRGCSSLLEANVDLAEQFVRGDYFAQEGIVELDTVPLDTAAETYEFSDACFAKIDIQGAELEVLRSGQKLLLDSVLAVRTEVSFVELYKGQPLFSDVDQFLRSKGFVLMGFPEMHSWRRHTRIKVPRLAPGPFPFSRAQLIHADALYFREPASLVADRSNTPEVIVKAVLLAIAYKHVDHALWLVKQPAVDNYISLHYGGSLQGDLSALSRALGRRQWMSHFASKTFAAIRRVAFRN